MSKTKIAILLILVLAFFFWHQKQVQVPVSKSSTADETIKVTSTIPSPLEDATILPSDAITITFNQTIDLTRMKFRVEPAVDLNLEYPKTEGDTVVVKFKKPLQLGSGYTLFVFPDPANKIPLKLDKDYVYHFRTIGYKGV